MLSKALAEDRSFLVPHRFRRVSVRHNKTIYPTKLDFAYYRHHLVLAMRDIFHFFSVKGFGRVLELQVSQGQFTL